MEKDRDFKELDNIIDGFFTLDREWRITYCNSKSANLLYKEPKELIGKVFWDVIPRLVRTKFETAFRKAMFMRIMQRVKMQGVSNEIWFEVSICPSEEGISTYISEQKEHESNLRETDRILSYEEELQNWKTALQTSEEKYKTLFNSMDDAFALIEMIFDENGKPVDWRYIETNKALENVALTGESVRFEDDVKVLNKWYDVNAFKIGGESSRRVAVIFKDITERKEREKELQIIKDSLGLEVEALKTLHSISSYAYSNGNLQYDKILNSAISLTNADRGHLSMIDEDGELKILSQNSLIDVLIKKLVDTKNYRTITRDAINLKRRVIVEDISEDSLTENYPYLINLVQLGIKTIQSTPMISNSGRVLGTLTTQYKTLHHFSERELQLLDLLSNEAAEIIERFNAEEALRQSEKRALALVDELRRQDENKNEFLSILSHELRNPLASIMMSLSLLNNQHLNGDSQKAVDIMTRQTYQLANLVEDLLDVTRISQNKVSLKRERVNLNKIISKAILDNNSHFADKGVKLFSELPSDPIYIDADPTRVAQIVGNLLHNASKFISPGDYTKVSIWESKEAKEAIIEVEDSGLGIAPDVLPDLFLPFMQVERTLDRSKGGIGLGLSIVKGMVELHGGSVSVSSEGIGKGAKFIVRLPLLAEQINFERTQALGSNLPSRCFRIVVIDDIPDVVEILSSLLRRKGHEVITALSGMEGIAKAKDFLPDVIFSDIGLPIMNGYEVAKSIRRDSQLKNTYLVALSGYAQPEDIEKAKEAGFDRHVAKPVDMEILQRILDEVI